MKTVFKKLGSSTFCFVYLLVCLGLCFMGQEMSAKSAGNRAYVSAGPDGAMYARCIPAAVHGTEGTTTVYMVEKKEDRVIDKYDWFSKNGVVLGWSPIKGQVSILAIQMGRNKDLTKQEELTISIGGKKVKTFTTEEMKKLGARTLTKRTTSGPWIRTSIKVLGCFQIPGTNQYVYKVDLGDDKVISIDITNGELVDK